MHTGPIALKDGEEEILVGLITCSGATYGDDNFQEGPDVGLNIAYFRKWIDGKDIRCYIVIE